MELALVINDHVSGKSGHTVNAMLMINIRDISSLLRVMCFFLGGRLGLQRGAYEVGEVRRVARTSSDVLRNWGEWVARIGSVVLRQ